MSSACVVLVACDNIWLANSVQTLLTREACCDPVHICDLENALSMLQLTCPDIIVVITGLAFLAHQVSLFRLRLEYPQTRSILSLPMNKSLYETHPFVANFDALLDESQLGLELIPIIKQLRDHGRP